MDRLVGELRTLSRLEAATSQAGDELVDVVEMVDQIADDARFEAGARIEVAAPSPLAVRGAPDLLWSAVENIVRNAVKHGGAGSKVEVMLHPEQDQVHIEVLDRGPFGAILPSGDWGIKRHRDEAGDWRGILDLSPAVADALDFNGREKVHIFYQRTARHLRAARNAPR